MSFFLPKEVRDGLETAQKRALKRKNRLHVRIGEQHFPIHEFTETGFTMTMDAAPRLRGFVDIYDGPRHVFYALIVACDEEAATLHYEFKRATAIQADAPIDYERSANAPVGYLTRN